MSMTECLNDDDDDDDDNMCSDSLNNTPSKCLPSPL